MQGKRGRVGHRLQHSISFGVAPCGVAPYAPIVHQAQHQIDVCAALLHVVDELLKGVELDVGLDDLEPKAMAA